MGLGIFPSDSLKGLKPNDIANVPASVLVEWIAAQASSSVYTYDLAEHVGFGTNTKEWKIGEVIDMQTRAGAGINLIGRLSEEGTSKDVKSESVLTAYNTPNGVATMTEALAYIPPPAPNRRLVIHVPTLTPVGASLELSPTLAPLVPVINILPSTFTVLLSATPRECVDFAALSYRLTKSHVVHLFDHFSAAREIGQAALRSPKGDEKTEVSVKDALSGAGYQLFDYVGDHDATEVIVVTNGPLALGAKAALKRTPGVGLIIVRVLRPWDEQAFLDITPKTVKRIHVIDEVPASGVQGILFADILSTVGLTPTITVKSTQVVPTRTKDFLKDPPSFASYLSGIAPGRQITEEVFEPIPPVKKALLFGTPTTPIALLPHYIVKSFPPGTSVSTRLLTDYDCFSKPGGLSATRILFTAKENKNDLPLPLYLPLGAQNDTDFGKADLLAVLDQSLLKTHALHHHLKQNGLLLVFTSWTGPELLANLPSDALTLIREKGVTIYRIDVKNLAENVPDKTRDDLQTIFGHLAFLRLYLGQSATEIALRKLAHVAYDSVLSPLSVDKINARAWAALEEVPLEEVEANDGNVTLKEFEFNAVNLTFDDGRLELPGSQLSNWHTAAKHILFSDAFVPPEVKDAAQDTFADNPALRPEIPDRTYLVTCAVNRRLTPLDYDRNVFHLEFDTSGTGLKYEIGEALGVHGWNDAQEVLDFCQWYGADPDKLITIPVPNNEGKRHTRSVFQALQQQIDIFGHPPKSFYTDLAAYATKKNEKLALLFIGSAEGQATYKKLSEKDTVTFADILKSYPSARPEIQVLCQMIGDIKPRHYSIASAQSVVGDRVDLLVVTVEWTNPQGSPRYGQCTRYLAGLKVGQKVTVSIKPSVMKLPPSNLQPLILAGLGTGAAPFRAFLQHRAHLAAQGIPVGPLYYYFGSRYRGKEYLYGEEIEAYILDGTITKAGLAFSRDDRKKVYIQHKMLEDAEDLVRFLRVDNGVFYLCGPTWPVPDVYETLVTALEKHHGMSAIEAGDYLEGLKEEERYVLEVY